MSTNFELVAGEVQKQETVKVGVTTEQDGDRVKWFLGGVHIASVVLSSIYGFVLCRVSGIGLQQLKRVGITNGGAIVDGCFI